VAASPAQQAAAAAQSAVNTALQQQKELTKELEKRGQVYAAKGEESQAQLETMFGRTGAQAVADYTKAFNEQIPAIRRSYQKKVEEFQPNLLTSKSYSGLVSALNERMSDYANRVRSEGEAGSARLYKTLEAPRNVFQSIAFDPAFNLQYDPRAMNIASNPPTVQSDVASMLRSGQYTNYNI